MTNQEKTWGRTHRFLKAGIAATTAALALSGCGLIYKPVGHTLNHYSLDEVVPYSLDSGDLNLTACGTGMGLNQLAGSFSRVIGRPSRLLVVTNTTAAYCSEAQAQKYKLLVQRNLYNNQAGVAQDNRIEAERWERVTALRRFQVYKDTIKAFGPLGGKECPDLSDPLGNNDNEFIYLTGILTSVQGLLNDIQANSSVGIPQNIAAEAGKSSECLSNRKWWGVPKALQAVVWLSVPGDAPPGAKPFQQLRESAALGAKSGVALPAMLYALAAYGQSDEAKEKQAIKMVAKIYNRYNPNAKPSEETSANTYLLLNQIAYSEALYLSDRIWISATGHRTPLEALGTFPGGNGGRSSGSKVDVNSLLN